MTEDLLHEIREGGIAWTTFNRPQARNAMTFAMYARLAELADEISADPAIRVWVIMGAGGKAFASGTDISQFREFRTAEDALNYEARIDKVLGALESCTKPVIAAITGACTGGGLGIAGCCDIRIADKGARFGLPIAKTLGNILNMHNFARFYALVGPAAVTEMIMTARLFSADEAKHIGLISEMLETPDDVSARAMELAINISGLAPLTLRATKEAIRRLRKATSEVGCSLHNDARRCRPLRNCSSRCQDVVDSANSKLRQGVSGRCVQHVTLGIGRLRSAAVGRSKSVCKVQRGQRGGASSAVECHRSITSQRACVVVLDLRCRSADRASTLGCNYLHNACVVFVIQLAVGDVDCQFTLRKICR
jgi:enoyl-CoA hydratase/carnithine racemase